jgi:transcriptional regulator with XRE-family HTH domain
MRFCDRLRVILAQKKITQSDLGRAVGVTQAAVSCWLRGRNTPTANKIADIARFIGVDLAVLFDSDTPIETDPTLSRHQDLAMQEIRQHMHWLTDADCDFVLQLIRTTRQRNQMDRARVESEKTTKKKK